MTMTYFKDGSPYNYLSEFADGSLNVGWLDAAEPYVRGDVPPQFTERLIEMCCHSINRTRGWHHCNLCQTPVETFRRPMTIRSPGGDFPVGFGEIRVVGEDQIRYAAPDMIVHYVIDHHYRPPTGFIEGVIRS